MLYCSILCFYIGDCEFVFKFIWLIKIVFSIFFLYENDCFRVKNNIKIYIVFNIMEFIFSDGVLE